MKKEKRTGVKKFVSRSITILCLGIFFYAGYGLIDIGIEYYQNRQVLSDTQDMFYNGVSANENTQGQDTRGSGEVRPEFNNLINGNTYVKGWITVDGTKNVYTMLYTKNTYTILIGY